jgi:hypothetical protein
MGVQDWLAHVRGLIESLENLFVPNQDSTAYYVSIWKLQISNDPIYVYFLLCT